MARKLIAYTRAGVAILVVVVLLSATAKAQNIAYRWQTGQKFSYEMEVVVNGDDEKITYKGIIHYTVDNAGDKQARVTYRGGLSESKQVKQVRSRGRFGPFGPRGFGGPPPIPSPFSRPTFAGKTQTTNRITITPRGETLAMEGDSQLPYLLGNVSLMPFEPLPEGDKKQWKVDSGVSITEKESDTRHRFGPFGPMGPFGGPEKKSVQAAGEVSSYVIREQSGDQVVVEKTYRLYTPQTDDKAAFEMAGEGTWTFDKNEHVPHAYDMNFRLNVKQGNTSTTIPISVKYNRISAEKIAQMEAAAKQRTEELAKAAADKKARAEAPLTDAEKEEVLRALASSNADTVQDALGRLEAKSPKEPDPEIAVAIERHLASSDRRTAGAAHKAMTKWSPDYALRKKLQKDYQGPGVLKSTGLMVESITPLYIGQIVQAQQPRMGSFWRAARVKKLMPDGKVELVFLSWGKERDTAVVSRRSIQLAPPELEQPEKPAKMETAAGKSRTWTDSTGRFQVDAELISVDDGKVSLRRPDGRTLTIDQAKLSDADQAYLRGLQEMENPFKLN